MSRRRRRANDFTDSLNSYRSNDIDTDSLCSISEYSSDEVKSTISEVHPVPDLNKRIDLFQVEQSAIKVNDKESNNPQSSVNENMTTKLSCTIKEQTEESHTKLKSITMGENSKRDSNYNINNTELNASSILEQKKHANNETKKFETILCSLDNQLNRMKEVSQTQQVLKRLSDKFVHSPRNFTERLLTIIEESVINNDDDRNETSAIDLSRLTTEFRKMCKFIEDESAPEWPPSPMSTPPCPQRVSISPACSKSDHIKNFKNDKLCSPINASVSITPISGKDIIRKRFFAKISKNNYNGNIDSVINESGSTSFEHLEAQCNRLFPEEKEYSKPLLKSSSMPSLLSMSQIHDICEQQMASLNVSNDENHKENTILSMPNLLDKCIYQSPIISKPEHSFSKLNELHNKSKDNQKITNNLSYSKKKSRKMNEKFDNITPDKLTNSYEMLDPDDLQKTLFEDIAKKRKRCLDTAKLITEINADPEVIKTLRMSPLFTTDDESNSLEDETKFLQTLVSCKDYQSYLEKQKPLFKLLQNSNSCATETNIKKTEKSDEKCERNTVSKKETWNIKKSPYRRKCTLLSPNVKSCNLYTSPLSKKQGNEKEGQKENVKPKLFVTPGKSPSNTDHKKKKVYFPNMHSPVKHTKVRHILKSPHAEGLYRLNYNTVISPVGMYIRGTDMQLIKNVRAKTDNLLLTPVKRNVKISLNKNLKEENTPPKCINKSQEKTPLKINLSPKVNVYKQEAYKNLLENDNMPKNNFILPKVSYKLPLQIKTIKENESPKQGPRMKKLLEVAQSKIVIRHQGRKNSAQKVKNLANNEVYEINYEPEDESIHIEQAANKTNFIHNGLKVDGKH
ncbi:PREDICTED: uncharacterized protein LOC108548545 [Eufriesea mexicana]|uniref:uncharacterized protein LOC108548545 n=1 Tax=Eufriesea mexicana TaxID=516756 RepID=UPI00083C3D1B|nr:PREDICTED: uncharacterized protein LOC108548545 [Eufriesea mexicana]